MTSRYPTLAGEPLPEIGAKVAEGEMKWLAE